MIPPGAKKRWLNIGGSEGFTSFGGSSTTVGGIRYWAADSASFGEAGSAPIGILLDPALMGDPDRAKEIRASFWFESNNTVVPDAVWEPGLWLITGSAGGPAFRTNPSTRKLTSALITLGAVLTEKRLVTPPTRLIKGAYLYGIVVGSNFGAIPNSRWNTAGRLEWRYAD